MAGGWHDPRARAGQAAQDHGGALGYLGAVLAQAEPDLAGGLVQQAVLVPDHRHAEHATLDSHRPRPSVACSLGEAIEWTTIRARDLGIRIGVLPTGPTASIADVPGLGVGHVTVWRDEPPPPAGRGVARTGVTVIDPGGNMFASPVPAGGAVLNGAGECTGFLATAEWGLAETPVFLTSTMQVGRVYDAACELLMAEDPRIGTDDVIIPIVAECDDSFLSDARRMQVSAADVTGGAGGRPGGGRGGAAAGAGGGRGRRRHRDELPGFKGGIGTASRVVAVRAHRRRAGADEFRRSAAPDRRRRPGRPAAAASAETAGRPPAWPGRPPARASR